MQSTSLMTSSLVTPALWCQSLALIILLLLSCNVVQAQEQPRKWGEWPTWGDQGDGTYHNPVLPSDYSDIDCIRVGSDYYAISSTMQFSPGMVILHSKDMVNWRIAGHAVSDLTLIGPELNWDRMNRYGKGVWAGAIRYHAGKFWIYFGTPDEGYFMTTATNPAGPWEPLHQVLNEPGWDDCCPFWDDDGQGYFVGTHFRDGYKTYIYKMTPDGRNILKDTGVLINEGRGREASKLYKINGWYYHFFSQTGDGRHMMMQRSKNIMGPYTEVKRLAQRNREANEPNQGGLVQTEAGDWFFYTHHGVGSWEGRANSLLPVTWVEGWPIIGAVGPDGIGTMVWSGKKPVQNTPIVTPQTDDEFNTSILPVQWEWNYQPRAEKWSLTQRPGWLRLHAFKPLRPDDLLRAGNTLTQRSIRTTSNEVVIKLDLSGMADGQKAGLCHFVSTHHSVLGVAQEGTTRRLEYKNDGKITAGPLLTGDTLWLRSVWGLEGKSQYSYSVDGKTFTDFGEPYQLAWGSYRGDRIGIYSYNNKAEAGYVDVDFFHYTYSGPHNRAKATQVGLVNKNGGEQSHISLTERLAAIRTPKPPETPRINGPRIYGARPGRPFAWKIPVTGNKPIRYSAQGLPRGLVLDAATGLITGAVNARGSYPVRLTATNAQGKDTRSFKIVIGDTISLTPPMGWNTYNAFRMRINDALIRAQADAMVSSGLIEHGWSYINIDDGWQGQRDAQGRIQGNKNFPDMKALAGYVHSKSLKFGLYSSPGPKTCARFEGSYGHEDQDAATYSAWGVDYLKYDWCFYDSIAQDITAREYAKLLPEFAEQIKVLTTEKIPLTERRPRAPESNERIKVLTTRLEEIQKQVDPEKRRQIQREILIAPYLRFQDSLKKVNRDIVYSVCQYGMGNVWEWGSQTGANAWRTTRDITPRFPAIQSIVAKQTGLEKWAAPGRWNDPDMLEIGNGELTPDEMYSQMTWWSLLAAPLLIGTDLTKMDELVVSIFSNDEVIAVNQDVLGKQGYRIRQSGSSETGLQEVWVKPLADGTLAVGLFNLGEEPAEVSVSLQELGRKGPQQMRDLWRGKALPDVTATFSATVARHSAELFRLGTPTPQ